jgi:hypothetical protein
LLPDVIVEFFSISYFFIKTSSNSGDDQTVLIWLYPTEIIYAQLFTGSNSVLFRVNRAMAPAGSFYYVKKIKVLFEPNGIFNPDKRQLVWMLNQKKHSGPTE